MSCGKVQQAVAGRVVLPTFVPEKTVISGDCQISRGTVNA